MGGDEEAVGRGEWREGKTEWGEVERVSRDPRTPLVSDLSPAFKVSQDQVGLGGSNTLKKENSRELRWLELQSWLCCLLSLSSHLTCVNLYFLICEVEILRVPVSQDCCEDENRASMLSSEHNIDTWQKLGKCLVVEWIMNIHRKNDAEAEAPMLWPPDVKIRLIGKDPDAGKDWGQEERRQRMRWLEASLTQWTWIWVSSGR